MPTTFAVLADTHYDSSPPSTRRQTDLADVLLLRTVHRLNRFLRPDAVFVLGDLLDRGEAPGGPAHRRTLRDILGLLDAPVAIIPGNHDGDPRAFYRDLPPPPESLAVGRTLIVPFVDLEEPGYNARRSRQDLSRLKSLRARHSGPMVTLQHVPVFPPGTHDCPYNYVNCDDVLAAMEGDGLTLAVSGHYHRGMPFHRRDTLAFAAAPALCESPFQFLEITIDGDRVQTHIRQLATPGTETLFDTHVHTPFAYCNENMDFAKAVRLADALGLAGLAFAEHSGHLYHDARTYGEARYLSPDSRLHGTRNQDRTDEYFTQGAAFLDPPHAFVGIEADCDFAGHPVLRPEDRRRALPIIGAMHQLPELRSPEPDTARAADEFLAVLHEFLRTGRIYSLAHPFRVFRRARQPVPPRLFEPTVALLKEYSVPAEVNFHTNEPPPAFVGLCLERGVRLTLGSDAHNLYEVGEFEPHLRLLRDCGVDGDLADVLAPPPEQMTTP